MYPIIFCGEISDEEDVSKKKKEWKIERRCADEFPYAEMEGCIDVESSHFEHLPVIIAVNDCSN